MLRMRKLWSVEMSRVGHAKKLAMILGVALWLPATSFAVNYETADTFVKTSSEELEGAKKVLSPMIEAMGSPADKSALAMSFVNQLKQLKKKVVKNKEESDKLDTIEENQNETERLKAANGLPDLLVRNKINEEKETNQQIRDAVASLGPASSMMLQNQSTPDTRATSVRRVIRVSMSVNSALPRKTLSSPQAGQMLKMMEQVNSDNEETTKKQDAANLIKMEQHFEEMALATTDSEAGIKEFLRAKQSKAPRSDEERLADADEIIKKQEAEKLSLRKKIVTEVFKTMIPQLTAIGKANDAVTKIGTSIATMLEKVRQTDLAEGKRAAKQEKVNCDSQMKTLGASNPLAPNTLTNAIYQGIIALHGGNAAYYANPVFLNGMNMLASSLKCSDRSQEVEKLYTGNLSTVINALRVVTDPSVLVQTAYAALKLLGDSQNQEVSLLQKSFDECNNVEKNNEKAKKLLASVHAAGQQAAEQYAPRGAQQRRGAFGPRHAGQM